jgi:NAD(P)-dependent dehydrogenase (short-subunit alcohol dehydrogenase family)
VLRAVAQSDDFERDPRPLAASGLGQTCEQQRKFDVPFGREHRQKVVELKHETDVARPPRGESSIGQFVESSRALIGPLDVVVSNAVNSWPTPSADIDAARLRDTFDVNFMGPQQLVAHALPVMIDSGQGDLIFVSSEVVGGTPRTWMSAYAASKHALEAWIAVLRNELDGTGVRASIVRPGPTRTEQGTNWSVEEMQLMRTGWHGPGGIRHAGTLQPDDVARVITSVVELPGNVHMRLVEVVPSVPRTAEAQG